MYIGEIVTVDAIVAKLNRNVRALISKGYPVGLHTCPKHNHSKFAAVGMVNWGGEDCPAPFFDVYVGDKCEHYEAINEMVRKACKIVGVSYTNMN